MKTSTKFFDIQRKIVAHITAQSWQEAPHSAVSYENDITDIFNELKSINESRDKSKKLTFNTLVLKMLSEGIKAAPEINAHIDFNLKTVAGKIDYFDNIDISVPVALDDGRMMTINMKDFGNKNLDEMMDYMNDVRRRMANTNLNQTMYDVSIENTMNALKSGHPIETLNRLRGAFMGNSKIEVLKGKAKKAYDAIPGTERLTKEDMRQGTITISNIGSVYRAGTVKTTLLELVKPQIVALCVDAVKSKKVPMEREDGTVYLADRKFFSFCAAFDHRACDFDALVPLFEKLDSIIENPKIIDEWVSK